MNQDNIKLAKTFFGNVFLFVCGLLIFTGLMGLSAYYFNNLTKPHQIDGPSNPNVNTDTQLDTNLTNKKPVSYRRLNTNGLSQRYIYLESKGREARMRELLSHYDNAPSYETRQVIARIYKVYPEILIAIAYADSSLGNYLKTPNNIGNVNNNDRGRRQDYATIEAGVNAIGKVLTNQYLGEKTTVGDLSYAGDCKIKCEKVYATSNENRQINVLNALSMIRDKQVNPNFAFRW